MFKLRLKRQEHLSAPVENYSVERAVGYSLSPAPYASDRNTVEIDQHNQFISYLCQVLVNKSILSIEELLAMLNNEWEIADLPSSHDHTSAMQTNENQRMDVNHPDRGKALKPHPDAKFVGGYPTDKLSSDIVLYVDPSLLNDPNVGMFTAFKTPGYNRVPLMRYRKD